MVTFSYNRHIIDKLHLWDKSGSPVGEPLLSIIGKSMDLIVFRMTSAITTAARIASGTGSGIGAGDALDTLLLFLADIKTRRCQD